ncbi:MAG: GFA family protein [Candidatus Portnoybacteria bacterium]|nr:GFA family protein [Candidatus Portnoybacteria bacterium]
MKKYTGRCQCGYIKFTLTGEPNDPHLCYCHMCQRLSGAPVVAWVNFPLSSLTYEGAKPALYRSSKKTQRGFCPKCGSSLFALDDGDKYICMTVTTLDDKNSIVPKFESFKESSPPWMCIPDVKKRLRKEKKQS